MHACLLLVCLTAPAAPPGDDLGPLLDRTAQETGKPYAVGRAFLEQQGKALLPLVREKAKSADHRQRDLARALLLRIEDPERFAAWQRGLWHHAVRLDMSRPGKAKALLTQTPEWFAGQKLELPVPAEGLVYDRSALPAVVDYLYSTGSQSETGWPRALQILGHLADPDYAPALVDCYAQHWQQDPLVEEALVKLGPGSLPALRHAVKDGARPISQQMSEAARIAAWAAIRRSSAAAKTLARLKDREAVPLLIDCLKAAEVRDQQSAFAHALGQLGQAEAAPVLFDLVARACRGVSEEGSRYQGINYGDARAALLRLGPAAKDFLAEQGKDGQARRVGQAQRRPTVNSVPPEPQTRWAGAALGPPYGEVLARGVAFELNQPQAAAKLYEAVGRTLPPAYLDRYLPRPEEPRRRDEAPPPISPDEYVAAGRQAFWSATGEWTHQAGGSLPDEAFEPALDLLVERALVYADSDDLARLARLHKPDWACDVFQAVLDRRYARHRGDAVARALAIWGDGRAVDTLCKLATQPEKCPPDALVEAALACGNARAGEVLDAVLAAAKAERVAPALREAAALAADVAPAARGDREALVKLLAHAQPAMREAAAWRLLRQGDTSGVGTLVAGTIERRGPVAVRTRNELVRQGNRVLDALKQHAAKTTVAAERVVAEAIVLRIGRPELAARFDREITYRSRGFLTRLGPQVGDYRMTGQHIAAQVGAEAVPLFEAEVVAPSGWGNDAVAPFALAEFKRKASMDLLMGRLRDLGAEPRTRGLLAHAIRDFGEEGVAAIKDVPAPDPDRAQFGPRVGRFRGATDALVSADPKAAAQNVVKGLTALAAEPGPKDGAWSGRVQGFLRIAARVEDPAMIGPILEVVKLDHKYVEPEAFQVLARYEDPRLTEPALDALLRSEEPRWRSGELVTLARQLKDQTAARLVKELRESKEAGRRARAIEAWASLVEGQSLWPTIYRGKDFKPDPREEQSRKTSYSVGYEAVLAAMDDPEPAVREAVAKAIPRVRQALSLKTDDRPVERLLSWLPKARAIPAETVEFLVWTHHPDVKPALVKAFRERGGRDRELLGGFAQGGTEWADAAPVVYESLQQAVKQPDGDPLAAARIAALFHLGREGRAGLHAAIEDPQMPLGVRVEAARTLAGAPYAQAYDDVIALRDEAAKMALDDPRVPTIVLLSVAKDDMASRQRYAVETLTISAAKLDPARGYPMLMKLFATLDEGDYRRRVTYTIEQIERERQRGK